MSRSGYSEDYDESYNNSAELYRGAVDRAIGGKRGQAFLLEMLNALDSMPVKRLVAYSFEEDGEVCALGVVGRARGLDMPKSSDDFEDDYSLDHRRLGRLFGIAQSMTREIMWMNDEAVCHKETPEQRWQRMRNWVDLHLTGR